MKHKVIKTDNYLLVVDEDITKAKEGCWIIRNGIEPIFCKEYFFFDFKEPYRKIIAHLPLNNAPILEGVPLLPPLEDDVKKLANKWAIDNADITMESNSALNKGFTGGYNKAKERFKYTEEDMFMLAAKVVNDIAKNRGNSHWNMFTTPKMIAEEFIQQPKYPVAFECEMWYNEFAGKRTAKTITNSQGQTQLVGTYIYE